MKVRNTSKRVIKLLNSKEKVMLIPGSEEAYEVSDCPDVQYYISAGDLIEVVARTTGKSTTKSVEEK